MKTKHIISALIILIVIVVGLRFIVRFIDSSHHDDATNTQTPTSASTPKSDLTESEVITALIKNWKAIAPAILPNYPPANKAFYGYPLAIQFIGNHKIFVSYQDDFNPFLAVLSYTEAGKFSYVEQQVLASGVQSKWQTWLSRYGNASSTLNFYQFTSTRTGTTVYPSDWVKVSSGVNGFK